MKKMFLGIFVVTIIVIGFGAWWLRRPMAPQIYSGPIETVRAGTIAEYSTLIRVAKERGFFRDNGLDVTIIEYPSGAPAMKGLLDGDVDITSAADFVGTRHSFETQDFKILAATFESPNAFQVVARKDHGIQNPSDIKGKKIGLSQKTMGEFFLGTWLDWNTISQSDVTLVDGQPAELATAIASGTVDAVITFNPHSYTIIQALGENASVFEAQNNKPLYGLTYVRPSFVREHPDTVQRFVEALTRAEQFVQNHPTEMKVFFAEQFQYSPDYIERVVSHMHFVATLSQSMLLQMENEARFVIAKKLTDKNTIPNFVDFIYFDALEALKPEAVTIIR